MSPPNDRASRSLLIGRQASMLAGFDYKIADSAGRAVGELHWPNMAQARNARVRWHGQDKDAGAVKMLCGGLNYRIEFEFLTRSWPNDTRFLLTQVGQATALATAELKFVPLSKAQGKMTLVQPFSAQLTRLARWPRHRFALQSQGLDIGLIEDRQWISLVREMSIELPSRLDLPTQLFVFFLACHLLQTQA